jgi:hypothetical protein
MKIFIVGVHGAIDFYDISMPYFYLKFESKETVSPCNRISSNGGGEKQVGLGQ